VVTPPLIKKLRRDPAIKLGVESFELRFIVVPLG
jgi:hypothetical protein